MTCELGWKPTGAGSGQLDERRRDAFGGIPSRPVSNRRPEDEFPGLRFGVSPSNPVCTKLVCSH